MIPSRNNFRISHAALAVFLWLLAVGICLGAGAEQGRLNVILWFDTEDYILPASDDAAGRLAKMLTERRIRATFKVVGEKARTLQSRGRRDVIAALRKHDIAYHTDFHSVHPTPTEYLADCGLLDGIEEFVRREGGGAEDVRRIFSVPTLGCYGQPGSSWAPQAIAALKRIHVAPHGTPCYVDEGDHVGLDQKPFWYMNALTVYRMNENCTRMDLHDPSAVEPAKQKVSNIADRLRKQGGGLISIYYHPCEWVHRQFWDGVNFSRGANPPRDQWRLPPQRSAEETDAAFARFGQYVDHIRGLPGVRFVTASDLPLLYPDPLRTTGIAAAELNEVASRLVAPGATGLTFQVMNNRAYSVADQFELLTRAAAELVSPGKSGPRTPSSRGASGLIAKGLLGPEAPPPPSRKADVKWAAFRDAVFDVRDFIETQKRVPSRVFIGSEAVPPGDFLVALASFWLFHREFGQPPDGVELGANRELLPARQIAEDTPGLFGGWVIHQENFRAPKLLELARLQSWTLKPALPANQ